MKYIHGSTCSTEDLLEILSAYDGPGSTQVVRWCIKCGGISVDVDYDNRTNPGQIMTMKFPASAYEGGTS